MNKVLRIALDFSSYESGKAMGFNRYVENLLDDLLINLEEPIKIVIFCQKKETLFLKRKYSNVVVKACFPKSRFFRFLVSQYIFVLNKFSVILFPANLTPFIYWGKGVVVVHDLIHLSHGSSLPKSVWLFKKVFCNMLYKRAQNVIAISNQTANELNVSYEIKAKVIRNPVRNIATTNSSKTKTKKILWPTSSANHKNFEQSIIAISKFCTLNPDWEVLVTGILASYNNEADLPKNLKILGYVDATKFKEIWSQAVCIFVPSKYEGFGLVYVEAALSNKLLVCCDIPVAEEVLGNAITETIRISSPYEHEQIFTALSEIKNYISKEIFFRNFSGIEYSAKQVAYEYSQVLKSDTA
jgi:glycosyltransferase involved in cell wall biosynthesis